MTQHSHSHSKAARLHEDNYNLGRRPHEYEVMVGGTHPSPCRVSRSHWSVKLGLGLKNVFLN